MRVERFNITIPGRKYEDSNGNEKTVWNNVGTLTEFHKEDGTISRLIEIPLLNLSANAYPIQKKENNNSGRNHNGDASRGNDPIEYPNEDINPEDIPF